jgi:alpha-amylase
MGGRLARLIAARKRYAYGKQKDYFDQPDCIGWTRSGHPSKSEGAGIAILLNTSWEYKTKKMLVGSSCKGEKWTDLLGWNWGGVEIDDFGEGKFIVGPRSIGIWVKEIAKGRDKIDRLIMDSIPEEGGSPRGSPRRSPARI